MPDRFKRVVRAGVTSEECNGSFYGMLKRFRFRVSRAGILADLKKASRYVKPSIRRKEKEEVASYGE
jgi:small subunit ribosomal protein S21